MMLMSREELEKYKTYRLMRRVGVAVRVAMYLGFAGFLTISLVNLVPGTPGAQMLSDFAGGPDGLMYHLGLSLAVIGCSLGYFLTTAPQYYRLVDELDAVADRLGLPPDTPCGPHRRR